MLGLTSKRELDALCFCSLKFFTLHPEAATHDHLEIANSALNAFVAGPSQAALAFLLTRSEIAVMPLATAGVPACVHFMIDLLAASL